MLFRNIINGIAVCRTTIATIFVLLCIAFSTSAFSNPFAPGWALKTEGSSIRFQSIKNGSKVETSSFATFSGGISDSGAASINILLDSVDTKVDLRNVRMRFLFFQTFEFPEAKVSLQLDQAVLQNLPEVRRKVITVPYQLSLHGVTRQYQASVAVTQISEGLIAVASSEPITLEVTDFGLAEGIRKLEEAANVTIVPSTSITFDLLFEKLGADASITSPPTAAPVAAALETQGNFSRNECVGRFEVLSRTDSIYFTHGSAELDPRSQHILDSIADVVKRCPDLVIEVSGHTDSDGSNQLNQVLSEQRAGSVRTYLLNNGIQSSQIVVAGYGETRPVTPNDSIDNKRRNRRIEFAVVN